MDFNLLHSVLVSRGDKDIDAQALQWNSRLNNKYYPPSGDILRRISEPNNTKLHNHLQDNYHLSNKKALFYNMREYYNQQLKKDPFDFIPLTFHIQHGTTDTEYLRFLEKFKDLNENK